MRKRRLLAWVLCLALLMPTLPAAAADTRYSDTAGHWAEAEINRWSDYGVLQGNNGEFAPDAAITRAETAAIYSRIMGYTETAPNNFTDLGEDWYTNDILKAHAAGIIEGDGSTVRPLDNITRQEAAVVLCRALGIELEENVTQTSFADDASIDAWAKASVQALSERKLVQGIGDNNFAPKANIDRASMVKMLDNAIKGFYNEAGTYTGNVSGFVVVSADGVYLSNMTVDGNLILAEGVQGGTVTYSNLTVKGETIIRSGELVEKKSEEKPDEKPDEKPVTPTGAVILTESSEGTAGDACIYALDKGRYYTVDKADGTRAYVKADGTLSDSAEDMALLSGTQITGVANGQTYTVTGHDSCDAFATEAEKDMLAKVHELTNNAGNMYNSTGIAVAVIKNGRIFYENYGYLQSAADAGFAEESTRTPVSEDTIFELMSLSKVYTGVMLSYLDAKGVVSMDDPVSKYFEVKPYVLPDGTPDGTEVMPTLEMLSSHTSGFPRMPHNWDWDGVDHDPDQPYVNYHVDRIQDELANVVYDFVPGTVSSYSNFGVAVLGQCLAKAYYGDEYEGNGGTKTYEDLLKELVCEPLGLESTAVVLNDEQLARKAFPHDWEGKTSYKWDFDAFAPAGGIRGSSKDVALWLAAQLGAYQAAPELTAAVAETGVPRVNLENVGRAYVGLGWHVQPNRPIPDAAPGFGDPANYPIPQNAGERYGQLYWHNGAGAGFNTQYMMCPETNSAVVVLTNNSDGRIPDPLCAQIMDWVLSDGSTGNKATEVVLAEGSLGVAGDRCITGLETGKYYTVTVGDAKQTADGLATTLYAKADGTLTDSFKQAGKLDGTEIKHSGVRILNGQTYKVTASDTAPDGKESRREYVETGLVGSIDQLYGNTGVIHTDREGEEENDKFPYPGADRYDISGLSMAYIWDNELSSAEAETGFENRGVTEEGGEAVDEHTLFEIGDFSQILLGMTLAEMDKLGYVDANDDLNKYYTNFPENPWNGNDDNGNLRGYRMPKLSDLAAKTSSLKVWPLHENANTGDWAADTASLKAYLDGLTDTVDNGKQLYGGWTGFADVGFTRFGSAILQMILVDEYNNNVDETEQVENYYELMNKLVLVPYGLEETDRIGSEKLTNNTALTVAQPHKANGEASELSDKDAYNLYAYGYPMMSTAYDMNRLLNAYLLAQNTNESAAEGEDKALFDAVAAAYDLGALRIDQNGRYTFWSAWTPGYCLSFVADGPNTGTVNSVMFLINNNTDTGDWFEDVAANNIVSYYLGLARSK